ncbi:phage-related minor tail protein [Paenibacillus sp. PastF-1]|nr:phage-related minor tail protein [Paenibacillus sp. PastF-2]MDF9852106.1 phage-related minor tail protein [Paenibacillus sp. PastM-2]MDF9858696.1 phage-related minor tail protein [Paenibacillus sp. PastF-1]MDH6483943.1 phage-related minor tail protein [Paenibacillus sp. PastH-2]MDH6511322.1 phage-related minor tail protein [Paenibacillus sp. PastM-3]
MQDTARAIEAIRISGDMVRPLRDGLQAAEREFDQLRRMPRISGILTETVKELKDAVRESTQLHQNLQQIARIRMPSNMFGNDLQRYTRDMQDLERRMRDINRIQGPQPADPGSGGGGGGGGADDSSGMWALGGAVLAGGAAAGIAAGVGLAAHQVFSFSEEYQQAINKMDFATNSSEKEIQEYGKSLINLYNMKLGEGLFDISEGMATVQQATQETGKELEKTSRYAILYRDAVGEDIKESVKAADTMSNVFEQNTGDMYNLLAQGWKKGLDQSSELLDSANEYSVYFKKIGFDANQMFDTFAAGLDAGAFNLDKVGDAVKEFGIRSKDGSKTSTEAYKILGLNAERMTATFAAGGPAAKKAFDQVVASIAAVKDPVKQSAAAVGLFGTQAEDLEIGVITSLGNVKSQFDSTKQTMEEIQKVKFNTIGQAFGSMGRTLQTSLILPISKELLPIFSGLAGKMTTWVPAVVGAFGRVGGAVKEAAVNVKWLFENGFDGKMEGVTVDYLTAFGLDKGTAEEIASRAGLMYDSIAGVVDDVKGLFRGGINMAAMFGFKKKDMKSITSGFEDTIGELMKYWAGFGKNLLGLWPSIREMFVSVGNIVRTVAPIIGTMATTATNGFLTIYRSLIPIGEYLAGKMWPIISNIFNYLGTQVFPQVSRLVDALVPKIMSIAGKAQEAFGAIGGWISRTFTELKPTLDNLFATFEFVWGAIKVVVTNAIDAIGGVISGLMTSLGGVIDFITGVFAGDWGKAWQGVRDVFTGIFEGLGALLAFPINVAVDAINAAIRGINKVKFDVPDWVPGMGGESFGFKIPEIPKIGGYAEGGYVDRPELAWVGEGRSPEWIIPENNSARSQSLLAAANRSMGGGNTSSTTTVGDFVYSPSFNFYGPADQEAVKDMEQRNRQEFSKQFEDYKRQQQRVSFG